MWRFCRPFSSKSIQGVRTDNFSSERSLHDIKAERQDPSMQLQEMAYGLILGICAVVLVMCVIAAIMSENIRNTVIASVTYKRAFALHMNIFSHLYNKALRKRKEELFALMKKKLQTVQGEKLILEIGAGTGANFEFLPGGSFLIALDPNPHMQPYLEENVKRFSHVHLKKFVCGPAENMHVIPDDSVEAVVCTLTLCSVEDLRATLAEITRVIKPGGHFYFLEHVADESGTWRNTFQHKLENLWKYFGDGCSCTRQTWTFLDNADFSQVHYEKFLMGGLRVIGYLMRPHIVGYAVK